MVELEHNALKYFTILAAFVYILSVAVLWIIYIYIILFSYFYWFCAFNGKENRELIE